MQAECRAEHAPAMQRRRLTSHEFTSAKVVKRREACKGNGEARQILISLLAGTEVVGEAMRPVFSERNEQKLERRTRLSPPRVGLWSQN